MARKIRTIKTRNRKKSLILVILKPFNDIIKSSYESF